ncbi:MAG TPA: ubiquinone/menaquinone biosynthesis methyltransferase [Gemmataceae bacterium]|nr:ubiquinone/menaquinone biosynthesis methyltransferase [Gemmataceae bacterium]
MSADMPHAGEPLPLDKAPSRIAGMFDAIAARYDLLNTVLSLGLDRRWRRRAIASLALTGNERVLDVCAGTADVSIGAALARPGSHRVIGVDFSGAMLAQGRDKIRAAGLSSQVQLVRGDAMHLPVADQSVDALTIAFGIRNVQVTDAACREMFRVLKPGGRVAFSDIALKRDLPPEVADSVAAYVGCVAGAIPIADYVRMLTEAGFEGVQVIDGKKDLNAYTKVEGGAGCCMPTEDPSGCCAAPSLHGELTELLTKYDVNEFAASVQVYALKPL